MPEIATNIQPATGYGREISAHLHRYKDKYVGQFL